MEGGNDMLNLKGESTSVALLLTSVDSEDITHGLRMREEVTRKANTNRITFVARVTSNESNALFCSESSVACTEAVVSCGHG